MNRIAIAGFAKCGTTWLQEVLADSSEVQMMSFEPSPAEVNNEISKEGQRVAFKHVNLITGGWNDLDRLEDVQWIVLLRDPIQRAISHYNHLVSVNILPLLDIESGLNSILDSIDESTDRSNRVLSSGLYYQHLDKLLSKVSRSKIKICSYHKIEMESSVFISDICDWLSIASFESTKMENRILVGAYGATRMNKLREKYNLDSKVDENGSLVMKQLGAIDKFRLAMKSIPEDSLEDRNVSLSDGLKSRLIAYYSNDVKQLVKELGVDISDWPNYRLFNSANS